MSQPKINPATGYVHYEEPENPAPIAEEATEVIPDSEPEATEVDE